MIPISASTTVMNPQAYTGDKHTDNLTHSHTSRHNTEYYGTEAGGCVTVNLTHSHTSRYNTEYYGTERGWWVCDCLAVILPVALPNVTTGDGRGMTHRIPVHSLLALDVTPR